MRRRRTDILCKKAFLNCNFTILPKPTIDGGLVRRSDEPNAQLDFPGALGPAS